MSYTTADVVQWLGVDTGVIDAALLTRIKTAVDQHAAKFYDLTSPEEEHDQALIMQCAALYRRKHSPNGVQGSGDTGTIVVTRFDPDIRELLGDRLITAGIFGPSANTEEEA